MGKQFAIEVSYSWYNKENKIVTSKSYFKSYSGYPLPLKHMAGKDECKKYSSRAEVLIDWRKYFQHDKTAKIVTI